jgi:mono/diheme cytochrome c family protein
MNNHASELPDSATKIGKKCWRILLVFAFLFVVTLAPLVARFAVDSPVDYPDIEEHFKYGSTGGEREAGFPYWIWKAIPHICEHKLLEGKKYPGQELKALGFIYEGDKDLPVGMSKRRHMGVDRVFLNCAVCHASTVRDTPTSPPKIYLGMPANTVDLMEFERFLFSCAKDEKFSSDFIIPEIQRQGGDLGLIDRYVVYPIAISIARERLLMLDTRFHFMLEQPDWGPGRVDTWGSAKANFNFFPHNRQVPEKERVGVTDFPSIWLQGPREGMQLHWDGNNTAVEERNRSAAYGTGATPPTLDRQRIKRIEAWLLTKNPPKYPYPIEQSLAAKGKALYKRYCASCHGTDGRHFDGKYVGKVTPIADIRTDPHRLDSYTYDVAVNQNLLYAGYGEERFSHFRKTFGYANMPLDGLWLRAPYLHNGSVPTLRDLLEPSAQRPKKFYRGNDVYDPIKVGFESKVAEENGKKYFQFNMVDEQGMIIPGNSNQGHEGQEYGTTLLAQDKEALVEYLKTF